MGVAYCAWHARAGFRLQLTRDKCLKGWEAAMQRMVSDLEGELANTDEEWKKQRALRGYAAEGVHMSIKQMSAQLLSVDIQAQEQYIELQRMRARQIWDECKHSKLHADVLLGKGWIKDERELMHNPLANVQPLPAYFGLSMMFPHIHPLARAAQIIIRRLLPAWASSWLPCAWWTIAKCGTSTSVSAMKSSCTSWRGKYQMDAYCSTQRPSARWWRRWIICCTRWGGCGDEGAYGLRRL